MVLLWLFLACGSSAREDWTWSWCSCLVHGDPGGAKSAGTLTASAAGATALSESSPGLWQLATSLWLVFLCCSVHSGTWRAPWWRSYSFVQWVRCLKGQPLCCSAASAGKWGKRGCSDGSTSMHDSAVLSCLHGCLVFLHKHFYHSILPHNILPSGHLASVSSRSCPGIAIQSLCSSSQLLCLLEAWVLVHSMDGCSKNFLCDSHSVYTVTDQLLPSQPQMLLLCPK